MSDEYDDPHWRLARRYGKAPLSSPVNEHLVQMLQAVFSREEAALVACFPRRSATAAQLALRAGLSREHAARLLGEMDRSGSVLAYETSGGEHKYALLPIIPGLFELFMCSGVDDERRRSFAEAFEAYYDESYFPAVAEGEDKPLKYPLMFRVCDATVLSKTDLIPHLDYDPELALEAIRSIKADMPVFPVSARCGEGMQPWLDWLMAG